MKRVLALQTSLIRGFYNDDEIAQSHQSWYPNFSENSSLCIIMGVPSIIKKSIKYQDKKQTKAN